MYIYNITTHVEVAIEQEWIKWMKEEFIPKMLATGCFTSAKFTRVMVADQTGGKTYSVQYFVNHKENLKGYYITYASEMTKFSQEKFGSKCLSFPTELEELCEITC